MLASNYDLVIVITESGLNRSTKDGEFIPAGYNIILCNPVRVEGRKQEGVFVAVPFGLILIVSACQCSLFEIVMQQSAIAISCYFNVMLCIYGKFVEERATCRSNTKGGFSNQVIMPGGSLPSG